MRFVPSLASVKSGAHNLWAPGEIIHSKNGIVSLTEEFICMSETSESDDEIDAIVD